MSGLASVAALLDTLAQATDSERCPGKCLHALAALMCNDVVRGKDLCPDGTLCCRPRAPPGDATLTPVGDNGLRSGKITIGVKKLKLGVETLILRSEKLKQ